MGEEEPPVGAEEPPVGAEQPPLMSIPEEPPVGEEEPPVGAEPPPLVPIPELCTQLGLNTFTQLIKENNLYSFLEAPPPGEKDI